MQHIISYITHDQDGACETLTIEWKRNHYAVTVTPSEAAEIDPDLSLVVDQGQPVLVAHRPAQRFRSAEFYRLAGEAYHHWQSGEYQTAATQGMEHT